VFGIIPTRTMRAHTVTIVDTTAWLFGGCDDKECSRDIFCFDTGTLQLLSLSLISSCCSSNTARPGSIAVVEWHH
jgi:hypothetical protein